MASVMMLVVAGRITSRPLARKPIGRLWDRRWHSVIACLLLSGLAWSAPTAPTQTPASPEYQVKAVFLFNFTQFVEWPAEAFAYAKAPLVIGVLGEDPFGTYLDDTVRGETANGRPLIVERYRRVQEIGDCQVLFISRSEADRLEQIFAALNGRRVLTVGDVEGFTRRGGMIHLATTTGKIQLRVNLQAATAAQLTISSKLLRPAQIVAPGKD
jgi:hypothetical protein